MTAADRSADEHAAQVHRARRVSGMARAAALSPERRSEIARQGGLASAAARRAKIEAEGRTVPKQDYLTRDNPTHEELSEFLEEVYRQYPTLSVTAQRRQAIILRRQYIANLAFEQGKPKPETGA
ncbi:hypothetical protein BFL35_07750 [Clavibacter michiganensis]|nr:hypothetical protein BFL35_07750 [Clavibacter michiganensis]